MKDLIRKIRNTLKHIGARLLLIALAVVLLTAGIAVYTGRHVLTTEKEVLRSRGELNAREAAQAILNRLFERVRNLQIAEIPRGEISISTGAVIHTEKDETSFADLYACADRAMYRSKETPGNSLTFGTV